MEGKIKKKGKGKRKALVGIENNIVKIDENIIVKEKYREEKNGYAPNINIVDIACRRVDDRFPRLRFGIWDIKSAADNWEEEQDKKWNEGVRVRERVRNEQGAKKKMFLLLQRECCSLFI